MPRQGETPFSSLGLERVRERDGRREGERAREGEIEKDTEAGIERKRARDQVISSAMTPRERSCIVGVVESDGVVESNHSFGNSPNDSSIATTPTIRVGVDAENVVLFHMEQPE